MPASKYFLAVGSREDPGVEYMSEEVSSLASVEDLRLTGLIHPDERRQATRTFIKRPVPIPVKESDQPVPNAPSI